MRHQLTITLEQGTHLSVSPHATSISDTLRYVPGGVVRGALAGAWIARHGRPQDCDKALRGDFKQLFGPEARYGYAFPITSGGQVDAPPPLSWYTHKYRANARCEDRIWDLAREDLPGETCEVCGSPYDRVKGGRGPRTYWDTGIGIGTSGTARRGELYSQEELVRDSEFTAAIDIPEEALPTLGELSTIRLGSGRTTRGRARVTVGEGVTTPRVEPEWLDADPRKPRQRKLVLRLTSPAVLVDELGRPSRDPSPWELRQALGEETVRRVGRRWVRWGTVGGWHIASGLPKPDETIVEAGSTYVVEVNVPPGGPDRELDDRVRALLLRGIGLRREEGFGALHLVAPDPGTVRSPGAMEDTPVGWTVLARADRFHAGPGLRDEEFAKNLRALLSPGVGAQTARRDLLDKATYILSQAEGGRFEGQARDLVSRVTELIGMDTEEIRAVLRMIGVLGQ